MRNAPSRPGRGAVLSRRCHGAPSRRCSDLKWSGSWTLGRVAVRLGVVVLVLLQVGHRAI